jgi:hypothetical protein
VSKLHIKIYPAFVFESAGPFQSTGFSMQHTYIERCWFTSIACVDFAMHCFFKANVQKNGTVTYLAVCYILLNGLAWRNPQKNLDVNITLSKCESNGVAAFERT